MVRDNPETFADLDGHDAFNFDQIFRDILKLPPPKTQQKNTQQQQQKDQQTKADPQSKDPQKPQKPEQQGSSQPSPSVQKKPDDQATSTVTVSAYEANTPFGHVGIGVNSTGTKGLYPASNSVGVALGKDVPAVLKDDTEKQFDSVTLPVTPKQAAAVQTYINGSLPPNSGTYNLYGRNCARFVEGALSAAGIAISDTKYPVDLMRDLHQRYDSDAPK